LSLGNCTDAGNGDEIIHEAHLVRAWILWISTFSRSSLQ
jgi:hypothetical protein